MRMRDSLTIYNATLPMKMRNFSGQEGDYNAAGERNFCVLIEPEQAEFLKQDGWNVKWLKPREEGEERQAYLPVKVKYGKYPPTIVLVSNRGKSRIDEEDLKMLDFADINVADVTINPSRWTVRGETGIKAYLKKLFVTLTEDDLDLKYANLPDSAVNNIGGCGNCEVCDGGCQHD